MLCKSYTATRGISRSYYDRDAWVLGFDTGGFWGQYAFYWQAVEDATEIGRGQRYGYVLSPWTAAELAEAGILVYIPEYARVPKPEWKRCPSCGETNCWEHDTKGLSCEECGEWHLRGDTLEDDDE